jgi:ribosomal protein S18 acetylase RimI-like enzyme/ribonuclease HI
MFFRSPLAYAHHATMTEKQKQDQPRNAANDFLVLVSDYDNSDMQYYNLMNGETLIGQACLVRSDSDPKIGCIHDLKIMSGFRNRGHGRNLIKHIVEIAKQQFRQINLTVNFDNRVAIYLYGVNGFRIVHKKNMESRSAFLMRLDQDKQPTVIYTDGSYRAAAGWAWCTAFGQYQSGFNSRYKNSLAAEILSVIQALKSIDHHDVEIVNDNTTVIENINQTSERLYIHFPELWEEYHKQSNGRHVFARHPHKEDKPFHNWCDMAARRASPKQELFSRFEAWWKEYTQSLVTSKDIESHVLEAWIAIHQRNVASSFKPPQVI